MKIESKYTKYAELNSIDSNLTILPITILLLLIKLTMTKTKNNKLL